MNDINRKSFINNKKKKNFILNNIIKKKTSHPCLI